MSNVDAMPEIRADAKTLAFHEKALVFDCLSLNYILDEFYSERALAGGVNATNVTVVFDVDWDAALAGIENCLERVEKNPLLALAICADDVLAAREAGKLAIILGTQGSIMVDKHLYRVEIMHRLGLRYFGLAYTAATLFADGCGEERDGGLTFLGRELVDFVNRLPLILDLSHSGHRARAEGAARANAPVCTHSNAYSINKNDRNTRDETAKVIAGKGGILGICGLPMSVWPQNPTIEHMLDHLDHYVGLLGPQHVGIGLDFTEAYQAEKQILPESRRWRTLRPDIFGTVDEFLTQQYPSGLSTIRQLPNFTQGLFDRGYSEAQIAGFLGDNWLRHFRSVIG